MEGLTREPMEVWEFLQTAGANERAIEWGRPYGTDIARAWDECDHGELMLSIAARFYAPPVLIGWSAIEMLRSSLPQDLRRVDTAILESIVGIEDWLASDSLDPLIGEEAALGACLREADACDDAVCSFASQAALSLLTALQHSQHGCQSWTVGAAGAVINCARLRAAIVVENGESGRDIIESIQTNALRDFATIARRYLPYSMLATSALGLILNPPFGDA